MGGVASWLSAHGVLGLVDRFRALAQDYLRRTRHLAPQAADLSSLAIHAIYAIVAQEISAIIAKYGAAPVAPADPYAGLSRVDRRRAQRAARRAQANAADSRELAGPVDPQRNTRDTRNTSSAVDPQRDTRNTRDTLSSDLSATQSHRHPFPLQGKGPGDEGDQSPLHPTRVAELNTTPYFFSASMILTSMQDQARHHTWQDVAGALEPVAVGRLLSRLGLTQHQKHRGRFYTITLPELARLIDAYRLNLPPVLTQYTHFQEDTLRATLPPGSPGAPLRPPSPLLLRLIGPDLLALSRPQPHP